jgi:hypothetical protein
MAADDEVATSIEIVELALHAIVGGTWEQAAAILGAEIGRQYHSHVVNLGV